MGLPGAAIWEEIAHKQQDSLCRYLKGSLRSPLDKKSPKSRRKEQNQLICDSDKGGGGVKKSEYFADVIYGSPLRTLAKYANLFRDSEPNKKVQIYH